MKLEVRKKGGKGDREITVIVGMREGACMPVWRARRIGKVQTMESEKIDVWVICDWKKK